MPSTYIIHRDKERFRQDVRNFNESITFSATYRVSHSVRYWIIYKLNIQSAHTHG